MHVLGWARMPLAPHVLHVYRQPSDPVTRTAADLETNALPDFCAFTACYLLLLACICKHLQA